LRKKRTKKIQYYKIVVRTDLEIFDGLEAGAVASLVAVSAAADPVVAVRLEADG
jgi:hypothetical protein